MSELKITLIATGIGVLFFFVTIFINNKLSK